KALAAFDAVLARDPYHSQALYGRAMILVEAGREEEAIVCFNRALDARGGFIEARRYPAVPLAPPRRARAAGPDINMCRVPGRGGGPTRYAAACVASLLAGHSSGDAADLFGNQALAFLERALAHGHGRDKAASDPDLRAIRGHPRFAELLGHAAGEPPSP